MHVRSLDVRILYHRIHAYVQFDAVLQSLPDIDMFLWWSDRRKLASVLPSNAVLRSSIVIAELVSMVSASGGFSKNPSSVRLLESIRPSFRSYCSGGEPMW
jgi:hypothetical protein